MYTNLDHLSSEKVNELKKRYYQGDSVYQLMAENELQIAPAMFYKLFPPEPVNNYGCSQCKVHLVKDTVSRSKQEQEIDPKQYYCPVCGRKPFAEKSGWISFPFLSDKERASKQQRIAAYYEKNLRPIEHDTLSLRQKVYLAVLCKALMDKEQKVIQPLYGTGITLASTKDMQEKIYTELIRKKVIIVSSESDLDAFDIESEHFPKEYDREKVSYKLNIVMPEDDGKYPTWPKKLLRFEYKETDPELKQLWLEIAIGECVTYLEYRLKKVGFNFTGGEKTKEVFQKLLENFSVSQIYYIIWCKVGDASRWYLEGGASKYRAANSVVGSCLRYGSNAVFYERELPKYHRPADRVHTQCVDAVFLS